MNGIEGKVVVITGASSGLGEATARHLAGQGAKLVPGARRTNRLRKLADELALGDAAAIGYCNTLTLPACICGCTITNDVVEQLDALSARIYSHDNSFPEQNESSSSLRRGSSVPAGADYSSV